ncbi:hypothetical protein MELA_01795 [Candidatus Methylomirabilis lanthanidiphila]|uniref:Heavy-metal-binding protein n=1 Tax=Candidatus Methylomirabilis lanthanidiphila TaxID=2211376 RepID=A0A564ZJ93_9BACT|nr:YbjQ family protein [Candidatus Methylomirabilis lanthanidiphila]VUZ85411.1 hypothetical protein MELA_01795 [Candidatus Methylomirabilis lanthanidiphila]
MAAVAAIIFVVIALFGLAWPFLYTYRIKWRTIALDKEIKYFQNRVAIATANAIPGRTTEQVLGPATGTSRIPASNNDERKLAEREAMHGLIKEAIRMGANAVLDLKMVTDSYEHTDPKRFLVFPAVKFTATKVTCAGTAVKVAAAGSSPE